MKSLFNLTVFLLLINNGLLAQCYVSYDRGLNSLTDLQIRGINGYVDTVIYTHYAVKNSFGEISKGNKTCEEQEIFNKDGSIDKVINYDSEGNVSDIDIYEYANGYISKISNYKMDGSLISKTAFVKSGNVIREQQYNSDGTIRDQHFLRTYDKNDNLIKEETRYNNDTAITTSNVTEFIYDSQNRLIKTVTDLGKTCNFIYENSQSYFPFKIECAFIDKTTKLIDRTRVIEYDDKNNVVKRFNSNKLSTSYTYTFDKYDNWVKRIEYKSEALIPSEIVERKITYLK